MLMQDRVKGTAVPVLNKAPRHEDLWEGKVLFHLLLALVIVAVVSFTTRPLYHKERTTVYNG
jgi:hypothetical protein